MHRRVIYQALALCPFVIVTPAPGDATLAFATTSHQVINKTVIYEDRTSYAQTPAEAAEEVTLDKYWRQLDVPVRRRFAVAEEGSNFSAPPAPQANDLPAWYQPLDRPTRLKRVTSEEGSLFAAPPRPEAKDQVAWWYELARPVRLKRLPVEAGLEFVGAAAGAGAEYNWFSGLDTPTRLKRSLWTEVGYTYFLPAAAEEVTVDKWWRELDRPVLRKRVTAEEGALFGATSLPQANDAVGWYAPLERPTRAKRLPASAIPFEARAPLLVVPWGWYAKLDDPTRLKKTPTGQLGYSFVGQTPGAGVAYNWFSALDEPLRIRRSPKTDLTWSSFTPAPTEVVTVDKWFVELTRPTRRTKPVPQQVGYTFVAAAPGRGVTYNWFSQLDTPVRARKSPKTVLGWGNYTPPVFGLAATSTSAQVTRRAFFFDRVAYSPPHAAGAGVAYNWFSALETPTRARKLRELPYSAFPVYFVPATPGAGFEYNWFQPIGEPVRPKRYLATQQGLTVPPQLLTVTLEYAWHQRLTEPTRRKVSLGQYPGTAQGNLSPIVPLAWQQLHTPHRVRVRINYEVPSAPYPQVELITADKWYRDLARPIYTRRIDRPALTAANINPVVPYAWHQLHTPLRLKGRIEYPAFTKPVFPFAFPGTGVGTNQPWPALSEPVRFSARIRPGQQQFLSNPSLVISSDLDPACRVYEVLEFSGIIQSEGDQDVEVVGTSDLVVDADHETLTPEPDDDIEVEC